jgi:hypothetical protein
MLYDQRVLVAHLKFKAVKEQNVLIFSGSNKPQSTAMFFDKIF